MYPARHADEAHTADTCPYHAKGNKQPRRLPACAKEGVVVALRFHKPRKEDKQQYVKPQSGENEKIGHAKNDFIADFVCKGTKFFVSLQQILKNI